MERRRQMATATVQWTISFRFWMATFIFNLKNKCESIRASRKWVFFHFKKAFHRTDSECIPHSVNQANTRRTSLAFASSNVAFDKCQNSHGCQRCANAFVWVCSRTTKRTWFSFIHGACVSVYTFEHCSRRRIHPFHIRFNCIWKFTYGKMSTVASALSIAGTRTSGAPVRTQNGEYTIRKMRIKLRQRKANRHECNGVCDCPQNIY